MKYLAILFVLVVLVAGTAAAQDAKSAPPFNASTQLRLTSRMAIATW